MPWFLQSVQDIDSIRWVRFAETFVHHCCSIFVLHKDNSGSSCDPFGTISHSVCGGYAAPVDFLATTDECEVDAYDVHSSMGTGFMLRSKVPHGPS